MLEVVGPNRLPGVQEPHVLKKLAKQFTHFFALMLWVAAVLAAVGGMPQLAVAIVVVVIVNGLFSFAQEERASRAAAALSELLPLRVSVLRDGRRAMVEADSLVPGDIVLLHEGDRISADARLLVADRLLVDNSTLTGESERVARNADTLDDQPEPISAADNLVFAGTYVAAGSGHAVVIATGKATLLGGIARMTGEVVRRPTPLQRDLNRTVKIIAAFAITAGVVFFGVSLLRGTPARDGFLFALGVTVALVPESMLPTVTLSLAWGARDHVAHHALVKRGWSRWRPSARSRSSVPTRPAP